jgi:predicted  nucleic acid-binding Zn-ribbon protein
MTKVIQIKISRETIEDATEKYLIGEIERICKKNNVVGQIEYQVSESAIEVIYPALQDKIMQLEKRIERLEADGRA